MRCLNHSRFVFVEYDYSKRNTNKDHRRKFYESTSIDLSDINAILYPNVNTLMRRNYKEKITSNIKKTTF